LKKCFISAPVLCHFNHERKIVVETTASNLVVTSVLSLYDDKGIPHPVAYFSSKHLPAEINCEIYDKELLMIVRAFKECCSHLECFHTPLRSSWIIET
jgi:hypothetical protein